MLSASISWCPCVLVKSCVWVERSTSQETRTYSGRNQCRKSTEGEADGRSFKVGTVLFVWLTAVCHGLATQVGYLIYTL